jgi:predicted nucleic acid-binding protein
MEAVEKSSKRVDAFLRECIVYPFDSDAALETAKVLAELWSTGQTHW